MLPIKKAVLLAILLASPTASHAIAVFDPASVAATNGVTAAVGTAASSISAAISTAATALGGMLTKIDSDIVKAISRQSQVQTAQQSEIAQIHNDEAVSTARKVAAANAELAAESPVGACGSRSIGQLQALSNHADAMVANAIGTKRAVRYRRSGSSGAQLFDTMKTHANKYCSSDDVTQGICDSVAPNGMANADVKAATLFGGAGAESKSTIGGRGETLTFDAEQQEAAQVFTSNVVDSGDSPRKLSPAEAQSSQGREYEALRLVYEARSSIPASQLDRIVARRTPIPGSGDVFVERFLPTKANPSNADPVTASFAKAYFSGLTEDQIRKRGVSSLDLMKFDVDRRYANPAWYQQINNTNDTALLREIAIMMAASLNYQYENFRDREVTSSIAATTALDSLKKEMRPRLEKAEADVIGQTH